MLLYVLIWCAHTHTYIYRDIYLLKICRGTRFQCLTSAWGHVSTLQDLLCDGIRHVQGLRMFGCHRIMWTCGRFGQFQQMRLDILITQCIGDYQGFSQFRQFISWELPLSPTAHLGWWSSSHLPRNGEVPLKQEVMVGSYDGLMFKFHMFHSSSAWFSMMTLW